MTDIETVNKIMSNALACGTCLAWERIKAKLLEVQKSSADTNNQKPAPEIVESNEVCDYCQIKDLKTCDDCHALGTGGHHLFVGRRLQA
jgi:DNA-directed RNA polymerase subunit M/transcription elongation factor TFIIS